MFVNFFIHRPIFASVIAIITVIAGSICIPILPVAQFPEIAPPTVQVTASYTGANAQTVEESVTAPIEQQVNGVEGMTYMYSNSASDGSSVLNVVFEIGYNLKIAAVDVQNQVATALPQLPEDVKKIGVTTKKQSTSMVLVVNIISPDESRNELFISNYSNINISDPLKRIEGVGDVNVFGARTYAMRFWLDPDKMASMQVTPTDVISAISNQNIQAAAGQIGSAPSPKGQVFTYTVTTKGRLESEEEFGDIILKTRPDGTIVHLKDVAEVELGAQDYSAFSRLNGKPTTSIGIYQLPGANSMDLANEIKATMQDLAKRFPSGLDYKIAYDTTQFVSASIEEVIHTLFEAIGLVLIVVFIFLQSWRATLIPILTIPVSLVGTFALMAVLGFSINTLSLFGLVLAIGLVVDDAIVVVENVARNIEDKGLDRIKATEVAMSEVVGPVIATTLVLFAVFVPVGFMPGLSGQLYKQFALTICCSVGLSGINALTLSPALCGTILKLDHSKKNWFFRKFDQGFDWVKDKYVKMVRGCIRFWYIVLIVFAGLALATYLLFTIVPTGFVPDEDQGYFMVLIRTPEGSSLDRTDKVCRQVEDIVLKMEGISDTIMIGGYNMLLGVNDPSAATAFVILNDWSERKTEALSVQGRIMEFYGIAQQKISDGMTMPFNAPPIMGLSTTGGFEFELQDVSGGELEDLAETADKFVRAAMQRPEIGSLTSSFQINYPQFYVDLDRSKAKLLGVDVNDVFTTLQAYLGSIYVNDFNKFGRVYRVYIQAKDHYRADREDITEFYVRSSKGEMIPLSALVKIKQIRGPQSIKRYNLYRTSALNGMPADGYTSGQAIAAMEEVAAEVLPSDFTYEWTGTAYQEIKSGNVAPLIFSLAIVLVFLFLAAQYESWSMPFMILLAVPLAIMGALAFQWMRGLANDVYCQIGLVMLIGLAAKNAILIVEFAKNLRVTGKPVEEAAVLAAEERLRPILMTSFAFILGLMPLFLASGAGAASRHSLGTAVIGGMLASTTLSLLVVPVFYVVIERLRERGIRKAGEDHGPGMPGADGAKETLDEES